MEKIRKIRKAFEGKYSAAYDLFFFNDSSVEINKESSFGSSSGRNHMSLPNLNDAFYRSIFNDSSDNKVSRSLTTLMTIISFESDDSEVISQIIHNDNLVPAEKCMKLLGLTDADVISARAKVRNRILENTETNKIQEEYAKNNEIGQNDSLKEYKIRDSFIIDYLMANISQCYPISKSETNDNQLEKTFGGVKEKKGGEILKQIDPYKIQKIDEKIDDVKANNELIIKLPIKPVEFRQPKGSKTSIVLDRIDEKNETDFVNFVKKKKKKKVCPLMRDKIKSRPCFPFVGNRQLKECPFKEQTILSDFIFPSHLNTLDKSSGEIYSTANRKIDDIRNDDKVSKENITCLDNVEVKKLFKNDSTITNLDQQEDTKINCNISSRSQMTSEKDFTHTKLKNNDILKEANVETTNSVKNTPETFHLEMRRNYNYIFNNRSHGLPYTSVFSTMSCLSFSQQFVTNPYGREFLIDEILDPRLRFNEEFPKNTNDVYKETLFKSFSSKNLFDEGKIMTQNTMITELLFKIPEQMTYHTDVEYKSVFNPRVKEKNLGLSLQNQELITKHGYASIKSEEGQKNKDSLNICESSLTRIDSNNNADNNSQKIGIQTTEDLDNYKYDNKVNNKNNDYTDNIYSKYSTNNNLNQLSNIDNLIENDECYKDNVENVSCCCNNWNTSTVADTSESKKSNPSERRFLYSNKIQKKSLNRLSNTKNKIVNVSFDNNKKFEYFNQSKHYVKSLKARRKLVTSRERELLEMKALRAYNDITLMEDKREMEEQKQDKIETIYSFINNNKSMRRQTMSGSKSKSKYREIQKNKEIDLDEFNMSQDRFDSHSEIEIRNLSGSFFENVSNINNEKLTKEKENIDFLENEPSSSRLPTIRNKDAAIMLNLLNRHGSYWFKQELRRILTIGDSQAHVKHSRPNQVAVKLDLPLRNCQKIDDSLEFDNNTEKEDISVPFGIPFSHQHLQTNLDLSSSKNLKIFNKVEEEIKTTDTPKVPEIVKIEKSEIEIANAEKDDASCSSTSSISVSSPPRTEDDIIESIDDFDHRQFRRRNMFLPVMDIARNVQWNLRPHGILLCNKNVHEMIIESSDLRIDQQRYIVDDVTASLVHDAFTYKPEIIVRPLSRDSRFMNDERSTSLTNNFYNTYRTVLSEIGSILHANYSENTLTLSNYLGVEDNANDLDNIPRSSCDSTDTDRIFNFYIFAREDEDFLLDLRPSSIDSLYENEIIRRDSEVTFNETRTMDIVDPEIDSSWSETIENFDQPSFEMLIAFFSFILALYIEILRSYFFSNTSDSHNSVYGYRPYEVHSDNIFQTNVSDELIPKKCDTVVSNYLVNVSELVVQFEEQEGIGVIDYTDEVEEDDRVSIESTSPQGSNIRDSFDTMYTKSTVESENAVSFGEGSLMEDFS